MKTVFETYGDLWPPERRAVLEALLSAIPCVELPADLDRLASISNPSGVIVVLNGYDLKAISELLFRGFEQFVQRDRPDFESELLASSLMVARPKAFLANPIPFFFNGFVAPQAKDVETNFSKSFLSTQSKGAVLEELQAFINQNSRMAALGDLVLQVADEMIMNAFFSGPVDGAGTHIYQNEPRSTPIKVSPLKPVKLFAAYSDYRVIVGCQDLFGSTKKDNVLRHLKATFENERAAPRKTGAGAGLGFKYMLESAANFYFFCETGKQSLVACGFLLKGFKANLSTHKHVHFSIR